MSWNWFKKIKDYYEEGFWTKEQVKIAVKKGVISSDEYKSIVGEDYLN